MLRREIYADAPPPGGLEACAALGGGLRQCRRVPLAVEALECGGAALGFIAGDPRLIAGYAQLRSYGGCQVPLPIQAADDRLVATIRGACVENRTTPAIDTAKFDLAERMLGDRYGFYRPQGGFFLWLDVGDGEQATLTLWREAAILAGLLPGGYTECAGSAASGAQPGAALIFRLARWFTTRRPWRRRSARISAACCNLGQAPPGLVGGNIRRARG